MGYVFGEDGFILIFKYDIKKNWIYFYFLMKLLEMWRKIRKWENFYNYSLEVWIKMVKYVVENVIVNVVRNFLNICKFCELKCYEKY